MGHAKVLLTLDNPEEQINLANKIYTETLSVREIENIILDNENERSGKKIAKQPKKTQYNSFTVIEEKLQGIFQTKVAVKGNEAKGKIEIEYYSKEEFIRLLEALNIEL